MTNLSLAFPTTSAREDRAWQLRRPYAFATVVVAIYASALLPFLIRHGFDLSAFIIAGDRFVDTRQLLSPIIVLPHSTGYDGQFYYRLALAPLHLEQPTFGVMFDDPPWRMQRILYPLLAWSIAAGRPEFTPAALVLVNLVGLGMIAAFAARITVQLRLHAFTPLLVVVWPGLIIALTHDTTEIVSVALILAALDSYIRDRIVAYGVLGSLAALTRETGVLFLAGVLCIACASEIRRGTLVRRWRRLAICAIALVPFLVWREVMHVIWHASTPVDIVDWPFLGAFTRLRETLVGLWFVAPVMGKDIALRVYILVTWIWLVGFCVVVATRLPVAFRRRDLAILAATWVPILALMSLLSADGPWIEPTAYFRAFSECYVIGCLLLGTLDLRRWLLVPALTGGALSWVAAWVMAAVQMGSLR